MSEYSEEWGRYKEEQKERRATRLPIRTQEILSLSELGYKVERKTDYQFRINDTIDLYPIHNRWHNVKTNKRGGARNLKEYILSNL